jgi:hypothetical protein
LNQEKRDSDESSVTVSVRALQSGNLVHRARHGESEDAALAGRRVHVDAPAVLLDDGAADGESKSGTTHRARVRCVNLLETPADIAGVPLMSLYFQCSEVDGVKRHISEECFCRGFKLKQCSFLLLVRIGDFTAGPSP